MANHSSDNEIGSDHAHDLLPSQGGICARCGKFIAPIPRAVSKHDEQTIALIRNGQPVSAVKFLCDNTGCDLSAAKEMVEHMYGLAHRPLGGPCPSCGTPLRTPRAKLCAHCGARIHSAIDP
jgi:zinc-ribbon domain